MLTGEFDETIVDTVLWLKFLVFSPSCACYTINVFISCRLLKQRASELTARRNEAQLLLKYAAKLDREEQKVAALESKAMRALTRPPVLKIRDHSAFALPSANSAASLPKPAPRSRSLSSATPPSSEAARPSRATRLASSVRSSIPPKPSSQHRAPEASKEVTAGNNMATCSVSPRSITPGRFSC